MQFAVVVGFIESIKVKIKLLKIIRTHPDLILLVKVHVFVPHQGLIKKQSEKWFSVKKPGKNILH